MERAVGWFVFLATALLLFGFGYYIYSTAERKGWFKIKAPFHVFVESSAGLGVGDSVYMMGFPVGQITSVEPQKPYEPHNVEVNFEIRDPFFRYLWTGGSFVKVNAAGFLNQRQLEVTRGTNGYAMVVTQPVTMFTNLDELMQDVVAEPGQWQLSQEVFDADTNLLFHAYDTLTASNLQVIAALKPASVYAYNNAVNRNRIVASWDGRFHRYKIFKPGDDTAWLRAVETPPVSDQLQAMVTQVQNALPGILSLTNKLSAVLDNAANATSNLNTAIIAVQPLATNFAVISDQLRAPGGPLVWALGTNSNEQIQSSLTNVDALLLNLAGITSNLNTQVRTNTNMLAGISKAVVDADDLVQGLKRHWLLRSAFKTNAPSKPKIKK